MMPMSSVNPLSFSLQVPKLLDHRQIHLILAIYPYIRISPSIHHSLVVFVGCHLPFATCHRHSITLFTDSFRPLFFAHPVLDAGTDAFSTGPVEPTAFSVFWRLRSRSCRRLRRVFQRGGALGRGFTIRCQQAAELGSTGQWSIGQMPGKLIPTSRSKNVEWLQFTAGDFNISLPGKHGEKKKSPFFCWWMSGGWFPILCLCNRFRIIQFPGWIHFPWINTSCKQRSNDLLSKELVTSWKKNWLLERFGDNWRGPQTYKPWRLVSHLTNDVFEHKRC